MTTTLRMLHKDHGRNIKKNILKMDDEALGKAAYHIGRKMETLANHVVGAGPNELRDRTALEIATLLNHDGDHHDYVAYRVEWHFVVDEVDENEKRINNLIRMRFPKKELAEAQFELDTTEHAGVDGLRKHIGRRIAKLNHRCYIERVEIPTAESV